jgi:WD40 repeat protein
MTAVNSLTFSPDGRLLAAGCSAQDNLRIWEVQAAAEVFRLRAHTSVINGVAFSADGKILASGASGGDIRLWGVP